jgi:hypothetical protein
MHAEPPRKAHYQFIAIFRDSDPAIPQWTMIAYPSMALSRHLLSRGAGTAGFQADAFWSRPSHQTPAKVQIIQTRNFYARSLETK